MARKSKAVRSKGVKLDAERMAKEKAAMKRTHRCVIYLNDKEQEALDEYCRRFNIESRSTIFRKATMERILEALDESHPTLF